MGFFDPQLFVLKIRLFIGCFFCWFGLFIEKSIFVEIFSSSSCSKLLIVLLCLDSLVKRTKTKQNKKTETFWENLFCSCLQNIDDLGASIRKCSSRLFCQKNKEKTFLDKLLAIVPILQIISDHQKTVLIFFTSCTAFT